MANNTTINSLPVLPYFDQLDTLESTLFIMVVIIFIPTVFGNSLIIISIYKFKCLQSPLNILIGNLAVSDLLMGLCLIPTEVIGTFFGLNRFRTMCLVRLALVQIFLMMSLVNMLAISIERYFSVRFPWTHRATKMMRYVCIFIPVSWTLNIAFGIIPILGWNTFSESKGKCEHLTVWTINHRYIVNTCICVFVSANMVIFFLVVKIALKRLPRVTGQEVDNTGIKRHLAKTYLLIMISAIFIVCWAPYCILSLIQLFINWNILDIAQAWTLVLGLLNSGLNWIIYGVKNEKFRNAFKLILCSKCIKRQNGIMQMQSTTL